MYPSFPTILFHVYVENGVFNFLSSKLGLKFVNSTLVENENCYAMTFGGDFNGLYVFFLSCVITTLTAAATKTKPIGDDDDCRFTIIVNSASTAAPIGLPPKMAELCHTSNRSLLGR